MNHRFYSDNAVFVLAVTPFFKVELFYPTITNVKFFFSKNVTYSCDYNKMHNDNVIL